MFCRLASPERCGVRPQDPDRVLRWVGAQLAERRRHLALTQEALAERLGVGVKYLQRLEAGSENLTLRSLVSLANDLHTSVVDLIARPRNSQSSRPGRPKKSSVRTRTNRSQRARSKRDG